VGSFFESRCFLHPSASHADTHKHTHTHTHTHIHKHTLSSVVVAQCTVVIIYTWPSNSFAASRADMHGIERPMHRWECLHTITISLFFFKARPLPTSRRQRRFSFTRSAVLSFNRPKVPGNPNGNLLTVLTIVLVIYRKEKLIKNVILFQQKTTQNNIMEVWRRCKTR